MQQPLVNLRGCMPTRWRGRLRWLVLIGLWTTLLVSLIAPPDAQAANISVDTAAELVTAITTANANGAADTITLTANITLNAELPQITSEITIEGGGHFISGGGIMRVLYVAASGNLSLHEVIIQNGYAENGAGIYNSRGTVSVTDSTLSGNRASKDGGGLYNYYGGTVSVTNSTLSGNMAVSGAGLYNMNTSTMSLTNSTLTSNTAQHGGGIINSIFSTLTITSSTLSDNTASIDGGGLFNDASSTLTITDSKLSDNTASRDGGGLYIGSGPVTITSSTLSDNTATERGGCIFNNGGTVTITSGTLSGNSVVNDSGGGIFNYSGTLTIKDSTLSSNTAAADGGGLFNHASLTITSSTLAGNSANYFGGGIYNTEYGTTIVTLSTLSGNTAAWGGGLYNDGTVTFINSSLAGNSAPGLGDTIRNSGTVRLAGTILNAAADGDNCSNAGTLTDGGYNLSSDASCGFTATGSVNNAMLDLEPLANNGGPTQTHALLRTSTAINQIPQDTIALEINLCPIVGSTDQRGQPRPVPTDGSCDAGAYEAGFAACLVPIDNPVTLGDCITWANTNTYESDTLTLGGDIMLRADLPQITSKITIEGGNHFISGGATRRVLSIASSGNLTLHDVTVRDGSADTGGGIYNNGGTVTITSSTVTGNTVTDTESTNGNGGGIANYGGTVRVTDSTLWGNMAFGSHSKGGGIYTETGTVTISRSTLSGNTATNGGGIYKHSGGVTLISSTLADNDATSFGDTIAGDVGIVEMAGTILDVGVGGVNCFGVVGFLDAGYNLSSDASCAFTQTSSVTNAVLSLGPLADNGGPTQTHALLSTSAALDKIPLDAPAQVFNMCPSTGSTDQRGQLRPIDGDGDGVLACDSGAVERAAVPSVIINNRSGFESNTTTLTFTVTRTGTTDLISTVDYTTADGTATAGSDYVAKNGSLTFAPGVTTRPIVIVLRGDAVVEGNETFFVNLSNPTGVTITDAQGQGIIRNSSVKLRLPADDTLIRDTTPAFAWNAIATATQYRLQVATTATFASPVIDEVVSTTSYTSASALADGKYYWRVIAGDAANKWGNWCIRWIVTIDTTPPAQPILIVPANGASITNSTPLFRWQVVAGADEYILQMDNDANFASPIINRTLTTTSYTQPGALADQVYYWRVRAVDAAGNVSAWSTRWSFTVNAVPMVQPTLIPTNTPRPTQTLRPTLVPTATATVVPTNVPTTTATAIPTEVQPLLPLVESDQSVVVKSGDWIAYDELAASGGRYLLSSTPADSLTLAFEGSEVTVVYIQHPSVGNFAIEVDGMLMQTVNSVAAEAVFGAEATISGLAHGQHVVKVYPVSGVVAIDAFRVEMALEVVIPTATPVPTDVPTNIPTDIPTGVPTEVPTETAVPTDVPTETPVSTEAPTVTPVPTNISTEAPVDVQPPAESTEEPVS